VIVGRVVFQSYKLNMATLSYPDTQLLERLFEMGGGYVLSFSDRTFAKFFNHELDINIEDHKYYIGRSNSKANRLRSFWKIEDNVIVGKSIVKLIECKKTNYLLSGETIPEIILKNIETCKTIGLRLMNNAAKQQGEMLEFCQFYEFEKYVGEGACAKAMLIYDKIIDKNFIEEIKLLYLTYHINVVRIFNYYLHADQYVGHIIMEFVKGDTIEEYLKKHHEGINNIFKQTIEGFLYLEKKKILHRDVRPQNILVTEDSTVKIIDFGFGKEIITSSDYITLNWFGGERPKEFDYNDNIDAKYTFQTEIYFVGRLFQIIINRENIKGFEYSQVLEEMVKIEPNERIESFVKIHYKISESQLNKTSTFNQHEQNVYRKFSSCLANIIDALHYNAKYFNDPAIIQSKLESLYKRNELNECVSDTSYIVNCFIDGGYIRTDNNFYISELKAFLELLQSCSEEKKIIIIDNLASYLDIIPRGSWQIVDGMPFVDDMPF